MNFIFLELEKLCGKSLSVHLNLSLNRQIIEFFNPFRKDDSVVCFYKPYPVCLMAYKEMVVLFFFVSLCMSGSAQVQLFHTERT